MTQEEIGDELGVSRQTVNEYIHSPPSEDVQNTLKEQARQVRMSAFSELQRHMREAGQRSRSAEKPIKVWRDDEGELNVQEITNDEGEVIKHIPIPADMVMGPDKEARFYARKEVREALDMLIDLTGAAEPERVELSGEVESGLSDAAIDKLGETIDEVL